MAFEGVFVLTCFGCIISYQLDGHGCTDLTRRGYISIHINVPQVGFFFEGWLECVDFLFKVYELCAASLFLAQLGLDRCFGHNDPFLSKIHNYLLSILHLHINDDSFQSEFFWSIYEYCVRSDIATLFIIFAKYFYNSVWASVVY